MLASMDEPALLIEALGRIAIEHPNSREWQAILHGAAEISSRLKALQKPRAGAGA